MPWTINYIFVLIRPLDRHCGDSFGTLLDYVSDVDNPNARRINKPDALCAGGLAIFVGLVLATLVFMPMIIHKDIWHVSTSGTSCRLLWGSVVALTGIIDDI